MEREGNPMCYSTLFFCHINPHVTVIYLMFSVHICCVEGSKDKEVTYVSKPLTGSLDVATKRKTRRWEPGIFFTQIWSKLKNTSWLWVWFPFCLFWCSLFSILHASAYPSSLTLVFACTCPGGRALPQEPAGFPSDRPRPQATPAAPPLFRTLLQRCRLRGACHAPPHGASGNPSPPSFSSSSSSSLPPFCPAANI